MSNTIKLIKVVDSNTVGTPIPGDVVIYAANDDTLHMRNDSGVDVQLSSNGLYGDGSDGDLNLSTGTTTLSRDMYYRNLTLSGGSIISNGFSIFVSGILNLDNAIANSIQFNGSNGAAAVADVGGAGGAVGTAGSLGIGSAGGAGADGSTGSGAAGVAGSDSASHANGGAGSAGSSGGVGKAGGANAGGVGGSGGAVSGAVSIRRSSTNLEYAASLINAGAGGGGGGSGGGDDVNNGQGGGGGGASAGIVGLWANNISRSIFTAASCISARGGNGASGATGSVGVVGGGGGGGGAGGGWIFLQYKSLLGPLVANALDASGGNGGHGGNGFGTGAAGANGGNGGNGGRISILCTASGAGSELDYTAMAGASGAAHVLLVGGAGGQGTSTQVNL